MKKRLLKLLLILLLFVLALFGCFIVADFMFPLNIQKNKTSQIILAQDKTPLWRFADNDGIWRYPVALNEVPPYYIEALLNYEDQHYYQHFGINPIALGRAAWQNLTNNRIISGGSTISMQVARILSPHDRTLLGKFKQIFRTFQLEWHYSKDEILTFYINHAPYGGTIEGIGAASWAYFGKLPTQLNRSDAVLLAVLPQAPSRFRPDRYPERARQARDKVLDRLAEKNIWPANLIKQIRQEEVWAFPRKAPQLAPLLARRLSQQYPEQTIIHSTIDPQLQYNLEDMAINWKNQLPPKTSLAILVVDHTDMSVKGYVGSVDFNDKDRYGQVDMITALRSPGSTLKPFIYAFALDDGMIHSESLLQDVPRMNSDYRPTNFDDGFYGPVSATEALQRSLNLPAVQLIELYGPKRFASKLASVGLSLVSSGNEPNISYILGGASVKMDELVSAYSAFARQGEVSALRFIQSDKLVKRHLLSAASAWITKNMLNNQQNLAYKTGTSYGYRDAWAVGINPRYLIGIWVGRPDGSPVVGQYGAVTAVPILQQVNTVLLNREMRLNRPLLVETQPTSVRLTTICWPSGQILANNDPNCHRQKQAWVINGVIPPTLDSMAVLNNSMYRSGWLTIWVNEQGKRVASDCSDAHKKQIAIWPVALENWLQPNEKRSALFPPVDERCPVRGNDVFAQLKITELEDKQIVRPLPNQTEVTLLLKHQGGFGRKWWFLDGHLMAELAEDVPFELTVSKKGPHSLLLLDESGQIARVTFTLE